MLCRLAVCLFLFAAPLSAQVLLLDQWSSNPAGSFPVFGADGAPGGKLATEDFVTTGPVLISQLEFIGEWASDAASLGTLSFNVRFHADIVGAIDSAPLASPSVSVTTQTVLLTQTLPGPRSILSFVLDLSPPVPLAAGTYWVALQESSSTVAEMKIHPADAFDVAHGRSGAGIFSPYPSWFAIPSANFTVRLRGIVTPVELLHFGAE